MAKQITIDEYEYTNPITKEVEKDSRLYLDDTPLHCGDVVEILTENGWEQARIEKSENWYLVGSSLNPIGLIARFIEA